MVRNNSFIRQALYLIGVCLLQVALGSAVVFVGVIITMFLTSISAKSAPYYFWGVLIFGFMVPTSIPLATSVFVYKQSSKMEKMGTDVWLPPITWSLVSFFFWMPAFAIFLLLKRYHFKNKGA